MEKQSFRKNAVYGVLFGIILSFLIIGMPRCSHADEIVKTTIVFRNDFVNPEAGESFTKQLTTIQWSVGKFNVGTDIFTNAKYDYLGVRPYVTYSVYDKLDVIGGYKTDSKGADYALAGFWYYPSFGNLKIFLDARGYEALSSKAKDFAEIFFATTYWMTEKNSVGLELVYDRFWEKKADDYVAGVCFSRKLTKNLAVFVRPTKDWYVPQSGSSTVTDSVRVGARLNF